MALIRFIIFYGYELRGNETGPSKGLQPRLVRYNSAFALVTSSHGHASASVSLTHMSTLNLGHILKLASSTLLLKSH